MTMEFDIPPGRIPEEWLKCVVKEAGKQGIYISGDFPDGTLSGKGQTGEYQIRGKKVYITLDNPFAEIIVEPQIRNILISSFYN